jgi:hypothetical protein
MPFSRFYSVLQSYCPSLGRFRKVARHQLSSILPVDYCICFVGSCGVSIHGRHPLLPRWLARVLILPSVLLSRLSRAVDQLPKGLDSPTTPAPLFLEISIWTIDDNHSGVVEGGDIRTPSEAG